MTDRRSWRCFSLKLFLENSTSGILSPHLAKVLRKLLQWISLSEMQPANVWGECLDQTFSARTFGVKFFGSLCYTMCILLNEFDLIGSICDLFRKITCVSSNVPRRLHWDWWWFSIFSEIPPSFCLFPGYLANTRPNQQVNNLETVCNLPYGSPWQCHCVTRDHLQAQMPIS